MAASLRRGRRKLRNSNNKASVAVIGGSGLEDLLEKAVRFRFGTPYGLPSPISLGEVNGKAVAFLPRHGPSHTIPPHQVNYRANLFALHQLGVERIFATNAVGGINRRLKPGDLVVPHDFVDFTKSRKGTYYDASPVTHVDMSQPYCPELRDTLLNALKRVGENAVERGVLACTEGPRYETPAEVKMLHSFGCDLVGMTGMPEAVLARELEMCYASLCYVSNMAAGLQEHQTVKELTKVADEKRGIIKEVLKEAISSLLKTRSCGCAHALDNAWL